MRPIALLLTVLAVSAGCSSESTTPPVVTSTGPFSQTDLVVGTGAVASNGNRLTVAYTGWLFDTGKPFGKGAQFDSQASYPFVLGAGQVIRGWDQGVPGMRVGGQRRLIIPPELAYGNASPGPGIPPNATLLFDITLNAVQ